METKLRKHAINVSFDILCEELQEKENIAARKKKHVFSEVTALSYKNKICIQRCIYTRRT